MAGHHDEPVAQEIRSTRERLLEEAVRLFGERGIEASSLRALTEAAGTNIAAVNYHFGSKEGLLRAVIDRTMRVTNTERARRLDELEAAQETPTVEELVRAFCEPGMELLDQHGRSGPAVARFLGRVVAEPDPGVRQIFAEQVDSVEGRFLTALNRALPDLDEDGVEFAYTSMLGMLSMRQTRAFAAVEWPRSRSPRSQSGQSGSDDAGRLVAFITAGILAVTGNGAAARP
jgi:AcrR family transcriptional regulator